MDNDSRAGAAAGAVNGGEFSPTGRVAVWAARGPFSRAVAAVLVLVALAVLFVGWYLYLRAVNPQHVHAVALQWSGSWSTAYRVLCTNTFVRGVTGNFRACLISTATISQNRSALFRDMDFLVPAIGIAFILTALVAVRVFWTRRMQRLAKVAIVATVLAAALDIAQDGALLFALRSGFHPHREIALRLAQAASFVKFTLLGLPILIFVLAVTVTLWRASTHSFTVRRWVSALDGRPPTGAVHPPERSESQLASWVAPPPAGHVQPKEGSAGICVSGGGIRSASVALGALQSLQSAKLLQKADYLTSVSGGGYTVGAYQTLLAAARNEGRSEEEMAALTSGAFATGTPELDHVRRHSDYLSDSAGQWLLALGTLLRCVLMGIVVLGLVIVTVGIAFGALYHHLPIVAHFDNLRPLFLQSHTVNTKGVITPLVPGWPALPWGVWVAVVAAGVVAIAAYLFEVCTGRWSRWWASISAWFFALTGLLAVIGIAIPALFWVAAWLSWQVGSSKATVITSGSLTSVVGYFGALVATLWRKRTTISNTGGTIKGFFNRKLAGTVLPNSMVQMILLWLCLLAIVLGGLILAGWIATSDLDQTWWALVPVGALVVFGTFADTSWISLHPYYRRRLARAFALERRGDSVKCLADTPKPLSVWGKKVNGFPEVRFSCSANVTGQDRSPAGRRAVPYVLTGSRIGGPDVGYVDTGALEALVRPWGKPGRDPKTRWQGVIGRDLDVSSAVAISGAAFASAMGAQTRFFEVFLALTNVRLGAWLPNPAFVAVKAANQNCWAVPGLPKRRRLGLLAREVLNFHPSSARLLLVTDGGHYDNLGLLDLLRKGCKTIYCIDASGGSNSAGSLASTLGGTLAVAQETGLTVSFNNESIYDLVPGALGALPTDLFGDGKPLASLAPRISKGAVIQGEIGDARGGVEQSGVDGQPSRDQLIFAQASLPMDLAESQWYSLLVFAQENAGFPRDGTADQWFDGAQFDAYLDLGRYLGARVAELPPAATAALGGESLPATDVSPAAKQVPVASVDPG